MVEVLSVAAARRWPPRPCASSRCSYAAAVLKDAEADLFKEIAEGLESHHAATIFMHLPREARDRFLQHLPEKLKRDIQEHLTYPEDSVGRIDEHQLPGVPQQTYGPGGHRPDSHTGGEAFPASYAYVVDEQDRPQGRHEHARPAARGAGTAAGKA